MRGSGWEIKTGRRCASAWCVWHPQGQGRAWMGWPISSFPFRVSSLGDDKLTLSGYNYPGRLETLNTLIYSSKQSWDEWYDYDSHWSDVEIEAQSHKTRANGKEQISNQILSLQRLHFTMVSQASMSISHLQSIFFPVANYSPKIQVRTCHFFSQTSFTDP